MSKKEVEAADGQLQSVEEALSRSEQFIERYQKQLLYGGLAVLAVAVCAVLFVNYYLRPRNVEVADKVATCVYYFEQDSFRLALEGDGMNEGFADIVDAYGMSGSGDLAAYYAGVCCYQLGRFEEAIDYLKRFTPNSVSATPAAITLIGDCYVSMGEIDKAISQFEKAAKAENVLTAPRALSKAGICYEEQGNWAAAEKCYQTIKDKYFNSQLAAEVDKRIERCRDNQK